MLGSLLKQMVIAMERIPWEISRTFREHKMTMGGRRPQLAAIVKMLQDITSSWPTFMCIDALDECAGEQRVKLLDSLRKILEKSPGTRIFLTGRPHICGEIEERLSVRAISISISPRNDDIITYLCVRLGEDGTPVMDRNLRADILRKIPEKVSEMWVGGMTPKIPAKLSANVYI